MSEEQSKALKPIEAVKNTLSNLAPQFKMALPAHIPVERFVQIVTNAVANTPALLQADRNSLYLECMKAAQDGLVPDGKEGAIIPYAGKAKWVPMIGGLLKKIRNSGQVKSIHVQIVRKGEEFKTWSDDKGTHFYHEPNPFADEKGEPIGVWGRIETTSGGFYSDAMSAAEVERIRQSSKAKDSGPWRDWPEEMWKKTLLRRLSKIAPMSSDIQQTIERDDDLVDLNKKTVEVKSSEPKKSRLSQIVEQQAPEGLSEMQDQEAAT